MYDEVQLLISFTEMPKLKTCFQEKTSRSKLDSGQEYYTELLAVVVCN